MIKYLTIGALGVGAVALAWYFLAPRTVRASGTDARTATPLRLPGSAPIDPNPFEQKWGAGWVSDYLNPSPVIDVPIRTEERRPSLSQDSNPYYGYGQRMPGDIA